MTRFISTRARTSGDGIRDPYIFDSAGGPSPTETRVDEAVAGAAVHGKHVVLAVHGFNVSYAKGIRSLALLERELNLTSDHAFFGVLWPGDWIINIINYPAEAKDAVESGRRIALLLNRRFRGAASFSFISHSLGARVLLEAVMGLAVPARELCITAAAADDNCLAGPYAKVKRHAARTTVLSSKSDMTLKLAYPLGDFASDIFWRDKDSPWRTALGRKGPRPHEPPPVTPRQIPDGDKYDHGDYFPPSDGTPSPANARWRGAVKYMRRCLQGAPDTWP